MDGMSTAGASTGTGPVSVSTAGVNVAVLGAGANESLSSGSSGVAAALPDEEEGEGKTGVEDFGVKSFFVGNPTRWGPVAKTFVNTSAHDIVGLCETHKDTQDVKTLVAQRFPGRFAYWSPAE